MLLLELAHVLWIERLRSILIVYDGLYVFSMLKGPGYPRKQCWVYKYSFGVGLFERV